MMTILMMMMMVTIMTNMTMMIIILMVMMITKMTKMTKTLRKSIIICIASNAILVFYKNSAGSILLEFGKQGKQMSSSVVSTLLTHKVV